MEEHRKNTDSGEAGETLPQNPQAQRTCPDCGSTDTRLSHKRSVWTVLLGIFNLARYKCRTCGRRFYSPN